MVQSSFSPSLRRLIASILIAQLTLGTTFSSIALAQTPPDGPGGMPSLEHFENDPEVIRARKEAERLAQSIENAQEGSHPPKSPDTFRLAGQRLEISTGVANSPVQQHELSALNTALPNVAISDVRSEIKIRIDEAAGALVFEKTRGKTLYRHVVPGLDVVAAHFDIEMGLVVLRDGRMLAFDMIFAKSGLFQGPMPFFDVGRIPVELAASGEKLRVSFVTRGLKPFTAQEIAPKAVVPFDSETFKTHIWKAGDVILSGESGGNSTSGERKLLALLNREVVLTQIGTGEAMLSILALSVAPPEKGEMFLPLVHELTKVPEIARAMEARNPTEATSLDPFTAKALGAFPAESVAKLMSLSAAKSTTQIPGPLKDRFTLAEWQKSFEDIHRVALQQKVELQGADPRDWGLMWQDLTAKSINPEELNPGFLRKILTPVRMKKIAIVSGLTALTGGAAALGLQTDTGVEWAAYAMNTMYGSMVPDVLKDAAYRTPLIKSSLYLSAFVPLLWVVGSLVGKKMNWDFRKTLGAGGVRIYAAVLRPFFHYLSALARQPVLTQALRTGASVSSAWVNPLSKGKARQEKVKASHEALSSTLQKEKNSRALSWFLANLVVSQKRGIDPATLFMAQGTNLSAADLEKLFSDPAYQKKWNQVAEELHLGFQSLEAQGALKDVKNLSAADIQQYYELALKTANEIESRTPYQKARVKLSSGWRALKRGVLGQVADNGLTEYQFLTQTEPNAYVSGQFWKQFFIDYLLAVYQMGLVGERADLKHPEALAADPNGILSTNRAHLSDMLDQIRIYFVNVPASMMLTYQKKMDPKESLYEPIENTTLKTAQISEGFFPSIKTFMGGVLDLPTADYGHVFMRDFVKRIKTWQASLIMTVIARLIGGQSLPESVYAYIYMMIWGTWAYGWIWTPVNRGQQVYEEKAEVQLERLKSAQTRLSQGLRVGDEAQWKEGQEDLTRLFNDSPTLENQRLVQAVNAAETVLKIPKADRLRLAAELQQHYGALARLKLALEVQDEAMIRSAYTDVVARTSGYPGKSVTDPETLIKEAEALLQYSVAHPPVFTKANTAVGWLATMVVAGITTYWATSLSVETFQENLDWGEKIGIAGAKSAGIYAAIWYGQKAVNRLSETWKKIGGLSGVGTVCAHLLKPPQKN